MTLWERVEELVRRVGELEAHPERLGSSEKHFDRRLEALEQKFAPDDVVDTLMRELSSLDSLVCYAGEDAPPCLLDRVAALEDRCPKRPPVVTPLAVGEDPGRDELKLPESLVQETTAEFIARMQRAANATKSPHIEAVERGLVPTPDPWKDVADIAEALAREDSWLTVKSLARKLQSLARARVATEKP